MKLFGIVAMLVLVSTGFASAACDNYGNCYQSNGYGGVQGHNSNTGSNWSSQSYGSTTTGTDSHGNSWSYDRSSGSYQNYGTGETRQHTPHSCTGYNCR